MDSACFSTYQETLAELSREQKNSMLKELHYENEINPFVPSSEPQSDPDMNDLDEEGFQAVKTRPKKRKAPTDSRPNSPITPVSNTYQILDVDPLPAIPSDDSSKTERIPPIILRNAGSWIKISQTLNNNNIKYHKAKSTSEGIKIFPQSADAFRAMTKLFDGVALPYHTFSLQEEKKLKTVIRGVPTEFPVEDPTNDLSKQGIAPVKLVRMHKNDGTGGRIPMPLVIAIVQRDLRKIYDLETICGLNITVEPLRNNASTGQCFRCQLHGHAQSKCTAPHKCVKCGDAHPSYECTKARKEQPKCANCGGPHTANFRGCPHFITHAAQRLPPTNPWLQQKQPAALSNPFMHTETSFPPLPNQHRQELPQTHVKTPTQNQNPLSQNMQEVTKILSDMLRIFSETKASPEQSRAFLQNTQALLNIALR